MQAIDSLDNPRVVLKYKNVPNQYVILTVVKDNQNNNIIIPIEVETSTYANNIKIDINRVKSVYGYDRANPDLNKYIKDSIKNNNLEKIYEKKKSSTGKTPQSTSNYSIPSSDNTVNNQYMQNSEKNSQGLENSSSFSLPENINLKKKQLEIIQKENPAPDDYHTWVRSQDDIKTFDEVIDDDESFVWGDFSKEDAKRALENGYITIYSSQPIKNGVFVSTSKNQASDYAGSGKIYQKQVSLQEVAWINGDEGQYAKLPDTKYSQSNNEWSKYLKENWNLMPNSKKTFGFPTNEQLQTMDNKKISESADTLNLRETNRTNENFNAESKSANLDKPTSMSYKDIKLNETENIPINDILELLRDEGGYRKQEYVSNLRESIKKDGIKTPIEISIGSDGQYQIDNGKHRLQIAKELGIDKVPVKLVESWSDIVSRKVNKGAKENDRTTNNDNVLNEEGRNSSRMSRNSNELLENGGTGTRNVELFDGKSDSIKQRSSVQTSGNNIENSAKSSFLNQTNNVKQRRFVETVQKNSSATSEFKKAISKDNRGYYQIVSNEDALKSARNIITENGSEYVEDLFKRNEINSAESSAIADLLINDALQKGDNKKATELSLEYAEKLTKDGQFIQAASIIKRLSPKGMLLYANRQLENATATILYHIRN